MVTPPVLERALDLGGMYCRGPQSGLSRGIAVGTEASTGTGGRVGVTARPPSLRQATCTRIWEIRAPNRESGATCAQTAVSSTIFVMFPEPRHAVVFVLIGPSTPGRVGPPRRRPRLASGLPWPSGRPSGQLYARAPEARQFKHLWRESHEEESYDQDSSRNRWSRVHWLGGCPPADCRD